MGGKGGGGTTESRVTQSNLPEYAQPYYERLADRAEAISYEPYYTYNAPRMAPESQDILTARGGVRDIYGAGTPYVDTGLGYTDQITQGLMGSGYAPGTFNADQVSPYGLSTGGVFDNSQANFYMSPYQTQVTDWLKQQALDDYQYEKTLRDGEAVKAGAFGGSRQAVRESMAADDYLNRIAGIEATQRQSAYENAQQMFGRDRAARMEAEQFNIGSYLTADQANQQYGLEAQRLGELSRQFGGQYGLDASQLGLGGANQLGGLSELQRKMDTGAIEAMTGIGLDEQAYKQRQLELAYQDFLMQRDWPQQQTQYMSSILQGFPMSFNTETLLNQPYNPYSQLLGLGIAGAGLYNMFNGGA